MKGGEENGASTVLMVCESEFRKLRSEPWIRKASDVEVQTEKLLMRIAVSKLRWRTLEAEMMGDGDYVWVLISESAPRNVWKQAVSRMRVKRFSL